MAEEVDNVKNVVLSCAALDVREGEMTKECAE